MRRTNLMMVVTMLALATFASACDTVTDLGEVRMEGTWDAVGALNEQIDGSMSLRLIASSDGVFGGTWQQRNASRQLIDEGIVAQGVNNEGQITFNLLGFGGNGMVVFAGELTNAFRLEGDLQGYSLDAPAVFRRGPGGP